MGEMSEVWRLRRAVIRHPVHAWVKDAVDQATLLVYRDFCQWCSSLLAASLELSGAQRHLSDIGLRYRAAARVIDGFLRAIEQGMTPAEALPASRGPAAAAPLVGVASELAATGTEAGRLGAFGLALGCCGRHQGPALDRLAALTACRPRVETEAAVAAQSVLRAQVEVYDGALETIRRRHMASHPSARRPGGAPDSTLSHLQPAG